MIHLLQNNVEVRSDEDEAELSIGWWFWGLSDGNCSACLCICSKFSKSKLLKSKIVKMV